MIFSAKTKKLLLLGLLLLPLSGAHALLNFDGSRTQVFIFGHVSFDYSSNIFSDSTQRGDSSVIGEIGGEMNRRAGIIAVNARAKVTYQRYDTYSEENAADPNVSIELIKDSGRTTGTFTASVFRESRADSAINFRTNSWNVPLALKVDYLLNEKFHLTSEAGYLKRTYSNDNPQLLDYHDYSEAVDLFYVYTSKLDLVAGYRIRLSSTTTGADTYDHWFNVGATGALLAKLNGSVRLGYEIRDIDGGENYNHCNVLTALTWTMTRKLSLNGQLSRDFNTIATGSSVDSTIGALRASYSLNRKIETEAGLSYGKNIFLGGSQSSRRDEFFSAEAGVHYQVNEHFRASVNYNYLQNWSTLSVSDFNRHGFSIELSSRF